MDAASLMLPPQNNTTSTLDDLQLDLDLGVETNVTASTGVLRDEELAQFEIATLALIFVVTTVGNTCVLVALGRRRTKLSRMYFYLIHLSVADLVTAFFNVVPQLAWELTVTFRGGDFVCRTVKFGQLLGPYLSSFVLVLTAVDRYHAVCRPLSCRTWPARRAKRLVLGAWVCALLCCVPQLLVFSYKKVHGDGEEAHNYDCWATFEPAWGARAYVTWYACSVFLAPLLVLISAYTCICQAIWSNYNAKKQLHVHGQKQQQQQQQHPRAHSLRGISRAKMKTVKLTVVVIACYIGCSAPFISAQLWATWDPNAISSPFWSGPTFTIVTLLASLNSCVNPWIYLAFNPELARLLLLGRRSGATALGRGARPHRLGGGGSLVPGGGSDSSDSRSGGSAASCRPGSATQRALLRSSCCPGGAVVIINQRNHKDEVT